MDKVSFLSIIKTNVHSKASTQNKNVFWDKNTLNKSASDQVSFSSNKQNNSIDLEIVNISNLPRKKIYDTIMLFNSIDGPMVGNLVEFLSKEFKNVNKEDLKKGIADEYEIQAWFIAYLCKKDRDTKVIIAKDRYTNQPVGMISLMPLGIINNNKKFRAYATINLGVMSSHQGYGIGTKLVSEVLEEVKKENKSAAIFCDIANLFSKKIFDKHGFSNKHPDREKIFKTYFSSCENNFRNYFPHINMFSRYYFSSFETIPEEFYLKVINHDKEPIISVNINTSYVKPSIMYKLRKFEKLLKTFVKQEELL